MPAFLTNGRQQYSINKSKALLGFVGQQWEQHIVAELDSALNKWVDSVPDHRTFLVNWLLLTLNLCVTLVRWDPHREDAEFFRQSATLYANYYHLQILVHRPFIPSPRKPSALSFPSLAICTNAARSCSHLVDYSRERLGPVLHHLTVTRSHHYRWNRALISLFPDANIYIRDRSLVEHLGR